MVRGPRVEGLQETGVNSGIDSTFKPIEAKVRTDEEVWFSIWIPSWSDRCLVEVPDVSARQVVCSGWITGNTARKVAGKELGDSESLFITPPFEVCTPCQFVANLVVEVLVNTVPVGSLAIDCRIALRTEVCLSDISQIVIEGLGVHERLVVSLRKFKVEIRFLCQELAQRQVRLVLEGIAVRANITHVWVMAVKVIPTLDVTAADDELVGQLVRCQYTGMGERLTPLIGVRNRVEEVL